SRHPLSRKLLQRHQPVGTGERVQNRTWITIDVVVDVWAAQADDRRWIGVEVAKATDAVCAAPRVKGNHQVCGGSVIAMRNVNAVSELAQDPRPAHARGFVSGP